MDSFHRAIPLIGIKIQSSDHLKAEFLRIFPLVEDRVGVQALRRQHFTELDSRFVANTRFTTKIVSNWDDSETSDYTCHWVDRKRTRWLGVNIKNSPRKCNHIGALDLWPLFILAGYSTNTCSIPLSFIMRNTEFALDCFFFCCCFNVINVVQYDLISTAMFQRIGQNLFDATFGLSDILWSGDEILAAVLSLSHLQFW